LNPTMEGEGVNVIEAALAAMGMRAAVLVPVAELLPVMDPRHNLREIAKQMLLLEDHLGQPRKRCEDCIRKHFAFIEALAEEGCSLQPKGEFYLLFKDLQEMARRLYAELYRKLITHEDVAENVRMIRKPLLKLTMPWLAEEKYREIQSTGELESGREIPLGEIPLGEIPLGEIPLGEIPLGEIPLGLEDFLG
jgi:hypothetical protein